MFIWDKTKTKKICLCKSADEWKVQSWTIEQFEIHIGFDMKQTAQEYNPYFCFITKTQTAI